MIAMRPQVLRRRLAAIAAGAVLAAAGVGFGVAPDAQAAPDPGCESIRWGLFGSQWRTICDGPIRSDGSWERARRIWTPAGYVSGSSWCGTYSCTFNPGYYRQESTQGYEQYVVFPHNVLPDEPGHLAAGSVVIR